jgi:hypothetical protein
MVRGFPHFIHTPWYGQHQTRHGARDLWWRVMMPGLGLIGVVLAMIIWPALLAYFIASMLLCVGVGLTASGWRLRRIEQHTRRHRYAAPPLDLSHQEE